MYLKRTCTAIVLFKLLFGDVLFAFTPVAKRHIAWNKVLDIQEDFILLSSDFVRSQNRPAASLDGRLQSGVKKQTWKDRVDDSFYNSSVRYLE